MYMYIDNELSRYVTVFIPSLLRFSALRGRFHILWAVRPQPVGYGQVLSTGCRSRAFYVLEVITILLSLRTGCWGRETNRNHSEALHHSSNRWSSGWCYKDHVSALSLVVPGRLHQLPRIPVQPLATGSQRWSNSVWKVSTLFWIRSRKLRMEERWDVTSR